MILSITKQAHDPVSCHKSFSVGKSFVQRSQTQSSQFDKIYSYLHGCRLFYSLPTLGCDIIVTKDGIMDYRKKALVSLLIQVMSSHINKALTKLISWPISHVSLHISQHVL